MSPVFFDSLPIILAALAAVLLVANLVLLVVLLQTSRAASREHREDSRRGLLDQRHELSTALATLGSSFREDLSRLSDTVERRLLRIQDDSAQKLDEMRRTVDEKLQGTLEKRLGESFRLVSERLEQVHKGLGEMQSLASGVGDLKRVMSNVKTRGTWGEIQLGSLLEQILSPDQYEKNVRTRPGSSAHVEYAIKFPGNGEDGGCVYLPIDAKFPVEDYQRLVEAQEHADPIAAESAGKQLEARVRASAREIADKYVAPPATTDFALLFLPTEGLYAEVVRRTDLVELLQRESRVVVAGPTTLAALLNSLQMGFRTLAIQKRSSEVWEVLGAIKTEFSKFGDVMVKVQKKLAEAGSVIEQAQTRTRVIERKLKQVEAMPGQEAEKLLGIAAMSDS
jgi:DNA recombination protein RmuC